MKALITGVTGFRNRGVEAIVVPTVEQLQQRQPNCEVEILTKTPDYDLMRLQNCRATSIKDALINRSTRRLQRLIIQISQVYNPIAPDYHQIKKIIRQSSIVIATGGDIFSSDYGSLYRHLRPLQMALKANIPVVFLAQSIGPFKTSQEAEAWLNVARRAQLITVREKLSLEYVTQKLGLSTDLVKHTADPAFLLKPSPSETVNELLEFYGIDREQPKIAIAISQGISRYTNSDRENHLKAWYRVIKMLLDELDVQILLIPHVQDIYVNNDDRIIITDLLRSLDFDSRISLVGGDHSASEFKGLIGACDLVVAERMHACIAGLSSGICTVAIGYSVKARGIMTDLLGSQSQDFLISFQEFLDVDTSYPKIRQAWEQRIEIKRQLSQVLPKIKQNSANNFDLILKPAS